MDIDGRSGTLSKGGAMFVSVLGDLSLPSLDGAVVPARGARQSALLAALTARAGEVVAVDRLVDLLWDRTPPENPAASLHSLVFKLRASLARAGGRDVLLTRDRGYLLDLRAGDLDADTFDELVARAREEPPGQAADTLSEALGLWRGEAYAGFADSDIARLEALRLEELRRTAVERCGAALLEA